MKPAKKWPESFREWFQMKYGESPAWPGSTSVQYGAELFAAKQHVQSLTQRVELYEQYQAQHAAASEAWFACEQKYARKARTRAAKARRKR